ncbi:MAG: YqhA family protein [Candidatus Omnitrophica bacterium]|nr:YqhA family protein [Candidatus Omnitrophota bacterium]
MKKQNPLEQIFEAFLWKSRLVILLAVIFSLVGSFALFFSGSFEIYHTVRHLFPEGGSEPDYAKLLIGIIGAIDLYLIGIVLLIFAFGIYELFISKIDIARQDNHHNILEIASLDELKNKLIKVIIMVLIVSFFKAVLTTPYHTPLEMLYFGLAILCVATCTFFIHKIDKEE